MQALKTAAPLGEDDRIIDRVQRGDSAAYMALFDRYYARVESYARWLSRDSEAARDAASETFLRAYRSIQCYRVGEGSHYLAYLLQICRRLVGAEKTRASHLTISSIDENESLAAEKEDERDTPLVYLLEEERRVMLYEAVARLADDDREIIHLAFERDLSRRDIAEIMGKPSITAVTSHLYRALQKLRAVVAEQGYFISPSRAGRA